MRGVKHFSNKSEIQKGLKYPIGKMTKICPFFNYETSPKTDRRTDRQTFVLGGCASKNILPNYLRLETFRSDVSCESFRFFPGNSLKIGAQPAISGGGHG